MYAPALEIAPICQCRLSTWYFSAGYVNEVALSMRRPENNLNASWYGGGGTSFENVVDAIDVAFSLRRRAHRHRGVCRGEKKYCFRYCVVVTAHRKMKTAAVLRIRPNRHYRASNVGVSNCVASAVIGMLAVEAANESSTCFSN